MTRHQKIGWLIDAFICWTSTVEFEPHWQLETAADQPTTGIGVIRGKHCCAQAYKQVRARPLQIRARLG